MTARQLFEYALIELNKKKAPSLLLEDYNYFINKAIIQYINKCYNTYEINQQRVDDLRVLRSSVILTPTLSTNYGASSLLNKVYEVKLPDDYFHILNCLVEYTVSTPYHCYNTGDVVQFGAYRLTSDMFPQTINNYYFKPTYKRPYYFINNVSINNEYPTTDSQVDIDYTPFGTEIIPENIEKVKDNRYGNKSNVRMEIRYGKENSVFLLSKVYVDYLKSPKFISLSKEEIDEINDNSQILEFPDYVSQEIVNELIKILLENASDPRLQTHIPISQSIANPSQEQKR